MKDYTPPPELAELIRIYRIVHFKLETAHQFFKAYPPRPEHCLAFYPYDQEVAEYTDSGKRFKERVSLTGQQLVVTNRHHSGANFLTVQIVFQPTALYRLTGIPSYQLINQYLDAELIFSNEVRLVNEQLHHAKDYSEMLQILNRFVCFIKRNRVRPRTPIDGVGSLILKQEGKVSLDWLAKEACLSVKQFERNFEDQTGITPKLFARVTRFDKAYRMKQLYPERDWLSVALACGYHDYQHLVRDYKDFTAHTPSAFYKIEELGPERTWGLSDYYKDCIQ